MLVEHIRTADKSLMLDGLSVFLACVNEKSIKVYFDTQLCGALKARKMCSQNGPKVTKKFLRKESLQ